MPGLTTLRCHEDAIHTIVRADIYGGVTLSQMGAEPRDLQGIVANDVVLRTDIAQPNWARARQVTQRVPFDLIGLAPPAVERPLQSKDKLQSKSIQSFSLEFRDRGARSMRAVVSLSPKS